MSLASLIQKTEKAISALPDSGCAGCRNRKKRLLDKLAQLRKKQENQS